MANTIETQVLNRGAKNVVLKVHIHGDGTGEETDTLIADVSAYGMTEVTIREVQSALDGFSVELLWDATANVHAVAIPQSNSHQDFSKFGGIINNAGAGKTGDILMNTLGILINDYGTFTLHLRAVG